MSAPLVIAIDGPAGSGKSTLARGLARALRLPYVNTGAMYRALTARALETGVDPDDADAMLALLGAMRFELDRAETPPELRIDGREPGPWLTTPDVEAKVSAASRHRSVRTRMAGIQRRLAAGGAVMEGRDIATVVLPDATLKVFLDASAEERARRRDLERGAGSGALTERDTRDARVNPFVPAPGAVRIDSTSRTAEEVLAEVLALLERRRDAS